MGGGGGGGGRDIHFLLKTPSYSTVKPKPVLRSHSKRTPIDGFQYQLSLNAGQKYCRMLQGEHSAILTTFIKLPFSIKTFALTIFKWQIKTGFTVFWCFLSLSGSSVTCNPGRVYFLQVSLCSHLGKHTVCVSQPVHWCEFIIDMDSLCG